MIHNGHIWRKILIITSVADVSTGGGNHLINLVRGIYNCGWNITVVCLNRGSLFDTLQNEGIPVYLNLIQGKLDWRGLVRLRQLLQIKQPTIIHSHGERAMVLANWAARSVGTPFIITTIHRSILRTQIWSRLRRQIYALIEDFTLRHATTAIITVSESLQADLTQQRRHALDKVVTIHNGTHILAQETITSLRHEAIELRHKLYLNKNAYIIGSIGRIIYEKGYQYLIEALPTILALNPTVYVVVVGDGPDLNALERLAESKGVADRVKFVGHQADVYPWLALFDLFVLAAPWEPFGLVIIEAMKFAIPVIAVNSAGPAEIISHRRDGILVPPEDPVTLGQAIIEMSQNSELARKIGERGFVIATERFSTEKMIEQTLALYETLLSKHSYENNRAPD